MKNEFTCPCCGSSNSHELYRKADHPLILEGFPDTSVIVKCESCGSAYANPMPTQEQLDHIYGDLFLYPAEFSNADIKGHTKYIYQIEKLLPKKSVKLLDIGCASGLLLSLAASKGWQVFGIDISEKLLEAASFRIPQASLFLGHIEDAGYEDNSFDAVIALNLLEQLTNPAKLLREVNRILKPGGLFLFKTVRIDSIPARKRKMDWDHLKWPGHLIWFSKESLDLLLEKTNLRVRKSQVTGVPYIPGVKRYMDHRHTQNDQSKDTDTDTQMEIVKASMPLVKRVVKIILRSGHLKACASYFNSTFRLGDTITVIAEKESDMT